jgi:flagellar biosynthetic protein FliQ
VKGTGAVNTATIIHHAGTAILLVLLLSMPPIIVATVVGVLVSLIQALTQIQEQTLAFVPKIILMFVSLIVMLPFMSDALAGYMTRVAARIASGV